jgi:methyl-accepting chemotaxis protein
MTSIQKKLAFGLVPLILFFLLQALAVWFFGSRTTNAVGDTVRQNTVASSKLSEVAVLAQQVRRYEKEYFVYVSNPERRAGYVKEWTGTAEKIDKALFSMLANSEKALSSEDLVEVSKWKEAADFYSSEMKKVFANVDSRAQEVTRIAAAAAAAPVPSAAKAAATAASEPAPVVMYSPIEVNGMIGPGKDRLSGVLIAGVAKLAKVKTEQTLALPQIARQGFNQLLIGAVVLALLGAVIAIVVLLTLPKSIQTPILALSKAVDGISKGQVAAPFSTTNVAEFSVLEQGLERLRQSQKIMLERMGRRVE